MAVFTVRQGRRYRAAISLGWLERWVANDVIAEKLRVVGFSDVSVAGSGGSRTAEAMWPGPDTTGEMPIQITAVIDQTDTGIALAPN